MALKSAEAIGSRICAIDILDDGKNPCVIEVNINPGLEGIEKATGIDVAQRL